MFSQAAVNAVVFATAFKNQVPFKFIQAGHPKLLFAFENRSQA